MSDEKTNKASTSSTLLSEVPESFQIRIMKPSDERAVVEHLRQFFFKDEPLNIHINLLEHGPFKELEDNALKCIGEGNSAIAVMDSGKIVGVCLSGTITKECEEEINFTNPKLRKIFELLDYVEREIDTFGRFPDIDKFLALQIISVDGSLRGKGLAKMLIEKSLETARQQGLKICRVDCTSYFSARVVEKLGFQYIKELKYEDYQPNGEYVFRPQYPHTSVKSYFYKL